MQSFTTLIICADCHVACHTRCINSIPNNCGLPEEPATYMDPAEPAAKKPKLTPDSSLANKLSKSSGEERKKRGRKKKLSKQGNGVLLVQIRKRSSGLSTGIFAVSKNQQSTSDLDIKNGRDSGAGGDGGNGETRDVSGSIDVASKECVGGSSRIVGDLSSSNGHSDTNTDVNINCVKFEMSEDVMMEKMSQPRCVAVP